MTSDFPPLGGATDFSRLSTEELVGALRSLQHTVPSEAERISDLQQTVRELHVRRCELELQNRILRETQVELDASVRRYVDLYDHLPIPYLTLSTSGRILQANLVACQSLQRERALLVGSLVHDFLHPYDSGRFAWHLEECAGRGSPVQTELTLRMPDGSSLPVQLMSRLAPPVGGVEQLIHCAVMDISQLRKNERALQEINREQDTFNASISHDLRAPLITILNYAGIIKAEHADRLDEEGRMMVERIERAATRMERSLGQLLEYGNLARVEVQLEPLSLEEAVRQTLVEHAETIRQTRAEIVNQCPAQRVWASQSMLSLVLGHLLGNALKFIEADTPPRIRIMTESEGEALVVKIVDQGIGIDPKFHQKIFQVFERLHGYAKYPGTGIGLAIARRAVERMNGRIWVESEAGKGSSFCFGLRRV